jgi:hypothetical protein
MFEGMETDARRIWETNPNFSSEGNRDVNHVDQFRESDAFLPNDKIFIALGFCIHASVVQRIFSLVTCHTSLCTGNFAFIRESKSHQRAAVKFRPLY